MKLLELEPHFLKIETERSFLRVDSIDDADGIIFLCPKCFEDEPRGPVGTHSVICWRPRVPQTMEPKPGRWEFQGRTYADLTLVAGSSSVLLTSGCRAHFFVNGGEIRMV